MDLSTATQTSPIRPVDQLVLDLLRRDEGLSVTDLMERLEVTATAIRQRLDRLEESGYIERRKHSVGRGRPSFSYFLTDLGWRQAGVTYSDLAISLWNEVMAMPDEAMRMSLIDRVSARMGKAFGEMIPAGSLEERMRFMAGMMSSRRIPASLGSGPGLPILEVHACPYPDLVDMDDDRSACHLEERVLSEALGQQMELSQCKLDGHGCCQFKPVENREVCDVQS